MTRRQTTKTTDNHDMHRSGGGQIFHLLASLSPPPGDVYRYPTKIEPMPRDVLMPIVTEHLYVSSDTRIDLIAARLNTRLGLSLSPRDSSYYGDYYLDSSGLLEEIRLYQNVDPMFRSDSDPADDYWLEPDYRDYPLLLYVYGPEVDVEAFNLRLWHSCPRFDFGCVRTATYPSYGG